MTVLFTIFLVSFVMSIFIVAIGLIIYQYSFDNNTNSGGYNYNPNIEWLNSVIQSGLPGQYVTNPPPDLPN